MKLMQFLQASPRSSSINHECFIARTSENTVHIQSICLEMPHSSCFNNTYMLLTYRPCPLTPTLYVVANIISL